MEPITIAKATIVAAQQAKKPWFWMLLATIVLIPVFLLIFVLVAIVGVFTGTAAYFNDGLEQYEAAASDVALKLDIKNEISPYLIKVLFQKQNNFESTTATAAELQQFITTHLVEQTKQIVKVPIQGEVTPRPTPTPKPQPTYRPDTISKPSTSPSSPPEEIIYEDKIVINSRFYTTSEIFDVAKRSPFSIPLDELQFICALSLQGGLGSFGSGSFTNPIDGRVSSLYGWRRDPFSFNKDFHTGLDIVGVQHHTDIFAITDGVVYRVEPEGTYGNTLIIEHTTSSGVFYAFYAHLSAVTVTTGQRVTAGQSVGREGGEPGIDPNPGASTGHHLHFEIRYTPQRSSNTDPLTYIVGY